MHGYGSCYSVDVAKERAADPLCWHARGADQHLQRRRFAQSCADVVGVLAWMARRARPGPVVEDGRQHDPHQGSAYSICRRWRRSMRSTASR